MKLFVLHNRRYMSTLFIRKLRDEHRNTFWAVDEDTRNRLRSKLMQFILAFKI